MQTTTPNTYLLGRFKSSVPFSNSLNDLIYKAYTEMIEKSLLTYVEFVPGQPYADFTALQADINDNNRLLISTDFCENNIFGNQNTNCMFRAVHDYLHYTYNLDFSYESELLVNYYQNIVFKSMGASQYDLDLLNIETAGQIVYHKTTGDFPQNQRWFTISELRKLRYN